MEVEQRCKAATLGIVVKPRIVRGTPQIPRLHEVLELRSANNRKVLTAVPRWGDAD